VITLRRLAGASLAILLAAALWLPNLHRLYAPDLATYRASPGVAPRARAILAQELATWETRSAPSSAFAAMHATNPEWDFMTRTFLALSLADIAIASPPEKDRHLAALDAIIDDTLAVEQSQGQSAFLLPYVHDRSFVAAEGRSLFVDGEIALMLGVRQLVEPRASYAPLLRERARIVERAMQGSAMRSGESYPDECWTFCNTTALAALRVFDVVEGERHERLFAEWIAIAKRRLIDPASGLLVSSYSFTGAVKDGPEGSSIWMSARNLAIVDEPFARDQYARARLELGASIFGFGYAREWPRGRRGPADIDSGPIVPFFDVSAGSSGLAFVAASAFDDRPFLEELLTTLDFAAFPIERNGLRRYAAGNPVGDAVLLSAIVFGPVWDRVRAPGAESSR
jgi:hypothetical protein